MYRIDGRSSALGQYKRPICGETVALCLDCENKLCCKEPCEELLTDLETREGPPFWGPLFSEMLIERIFPDMPKENPQSFAAAQRKATGKAISKLVDYFAALTKEEGKCLKYYFIYKLNKEDGYNHREIAEILNLSRQRVSQIMNIIEGKS